MSISSVFTAIAETLAADNAGVNRSMHTRPVPAGQLKALLQQGREQEATDMLRKTMNWDTARAAQFIASLKATEKSAAHKLPVVVGAGERNTSYKLPAGRSRNSTQIEAILQEQKLAEANAGGTLLDYIRSKLRF